MESSSKELQKNKEIDAIWERRAEAYNNAKPEEKIPDLKDAFDSKFRKERFIPNVDDGITKINQLRVKCIEFLTKRFEDKASHDNAQKQFLRWCATKKTGN